MKYRSLGRTGWQISTIGLGAWAIGGSWGAVNDDESLATIHKAIDLGVNFIDTADVYGMGRSERLVGQVLRERRGERIYVATKAGRRLTPHTAEGYNARNLTSFVEDSLRHLGTETIDLLQLHCPPTAVYRTPAVFDSLDALVAAGKLRHYGVSVETVEEALLAMDHPGVQSIQIIYNAFRLKPAEAVFPMAKAKGVGILARVPLASGLLTGRIGPGTQFASDDHRNFNRHGEAFDVGETFSGVELGAALQAVEEIRRLAPAGVALGVFALRWILMEEAVTTAIPGARRPDQMAQNASAASLPPLNEEQMAGVREIYDRLIRPLVHHRW
ncbi:MAG TPA: aldo/keto reductase [Solibacterales bacterium]|nr:aldo/keto reductase [Bryobacterales bacterium]